MRLKLSKDVSSPADLILFFDKLYINNPSANIPNTIHTEKKLITDRKNKHRTKIIYIIILCVLLRDRPSIVISDNIKIRPKNIPRSFHFPIRFAVESVNMPNDKKLSPKSKRSP